MVDRFAALVAGRRAELAELIAGEVGKARWDALSEVDAMIGKAKLSGRAFHERTGTSSSPLGGTTLAVSHRPLGVMVVLGPFNFPGHLPNGHIMPALLAGNTVVFKPSEHAAAVGEWMGRAWLEASAPEGVVQVLQGAAGVAQDVIADRRVAGVLFTGGVAAGRAIHRSLAGRPEVLLALELGGNNPMIAWDLDDDEDRSVAARIIVRSAFVSAGQRCTCARRLIVPRTRSGAALVDEVIDLTGRLRIGDPLAEPQPFHGPLISAGAAAGVLSKQTLLVDGGAVSLLAARARTDLGPAFLQPGLIDVTDVPDPPDEEIFGPLLQVHRVADLDGAISVANSTRFGLAAAVLSPRQQTGHLALDRLRAGIVNWNQPTVGASGSAPFGGIGWSGNHRPAGFSAADYCADPVASLVADRLQDVAELHGVDGAEDD